ncbi:uncharacterized protein PAC_16354 [Phialocephala subalpina]|uniref:Uncharacterized protein n=1 Tax=Phialocephala subalpina TaxID=576137 RepID=A0A1L7XN46_9HELO|nr:uncharacterized protein PAC_16354 [Phialocephala subalpina]
MAHKIGRGIRYRHLPLRNHDSIRLLRLSPGLSFHGKIHVKLSEVSLSNLPAYEALSYAWGAETPGSTVYCDGKELLVTENCVDALRQLRYKWHSRTEKRARVLQGNDWGPLAVLGSICGRPWFTRKWTVQEYVLSRNAYFLCGGKTIEASILFEMFEFLILWRIFRGGEPTYNQPLFPGFSEYLVNFSRLKKGIEESDSKLDISITAFLGYGRFQVATNPKDAVYGLYGILQKASKVMPPPDYSKPVETVFIEAAKLAIIQDHSLRILLQTSESQQGSSLPSWVPDWSTRGSQAFELLELSPFCASGNAITRFKFVENGNMLRVQGCFVDTITRCAELHIETEPDSFKDNAAYREWITIANTLHKYPTGESLRRAFFSTIYHLCNVHDHMEYSKDSSEYVLLMGFELWLQAHWQGITTVTTAGAQVQNEQPQELLSTTWGKSKLEESLDGSAFQEMVTNQDACTFNDSAKIYCRETGFFVTTAGYMGKGLIEAKEGDLVALIAGVETPMVLRKEGEYYRSKGPCHVHGLMLGEKWLEDENNLVDILLR